MLRETLMTKYGDKTPTVETLTKWIDEETAKRLKVCMVCLMVVRLVGLHTCMLFQVCTHFIPPTDLHARSRSAAYLLTIALSRLCLIAGTWVWRICWSRHAWSAQRRQRGRR